jgi:hypothetical protein
VRTRRQKAEGNKQKAERRRQKADNKNAAFCFPPAAFWLSISASCVAVANPLRLHSLDKVAEALDSLGSMNRDD